MEASVENRLPAVSARLWIREKSATRGTKVSFKLLLFFLFMLYSNIAMLFPQLDAVRPVLIVAVAAMFMLILEVSQSRQSLKLMWPQSMLLIVLLGAAVVSTTGAIYARKSFEATIDLGKIVLIYILIENTVTTEKRLRKTFLTLVLCGLMPALGTIGNYLTGHFIEKTRGAWIGLFGNPNEDAYALLILIPLAGYIAATMRPMFRIALWGAIGIYLAAIFLTFSRGGLLGLLAVVGLAAWKQKSSVIRVVLVFVIIAGMAAGAMFWNRKAGFKDISKDMTVNQRIATMKAGLEMFIRNPLTGVGPANSMVAYPLYVPEGADCGCKDQLVVHNAYIQMLGEMGLSGFVPFMLFILIPLYQAWRMERSHTTMAPYATALELALVGFLVCGMSGGFSYTWWPYLMVALVTAAKRIHDSGVAAQAA